MPSITLSCGRVAIVDLIDYAAYGALAWHSLRSPQKADRYYAHRTIAGKTVYLHRLIAKPPSGVLVSFRNGDSLDCRRENLRGATRGQSNAAAKAKPGAAFRGVCQVGRGRFKATISDRERAKKSRYIGTFDTAEDAARAYDVAAIARFGEFARLNFPPQAEAA